ncbi:hypothetical protein GCM10020001_103980 [Nonomuraea salmonea]
MLRFRRGPGFECVVNFGPAEVPLPEGAKTLLRSDARAPGDPLGPDTAAWLDPTPSGPDTAARLDRMPFEPDTAARLDRMP